MKWKESRSVAGSIAMHLAESELVRWLGYPRGRRLEGQVLDRVNQARSWYAAHGRPFLALRSLTIESVGGEEIRLRGGATLTSKSLARRCLDSDACALVCVALSAGPEIDARVDKLWAADRPDEAFILDRLGVAVTEYLRMQLKARVEREAASSGFTVLPATGPGYSGWPLDDQRILLALLAGRGGPVPPGSLQAFDTGMLQPKLSMLLAFPLCISDELHVDVGMACSVCNYVNCSYRRMSYSGGSGPPEEIALKEAR